MIKAVLDTNVILSAVFWRGSPYKLVQKGLRKEFEIILSSKILDEVSNKLLNKFNFPEEELNELMQVLTFYCNVVSPKIKLDIVKEDPSDNIILEAAIESKADYIITGDKHLLKLKKYKNTKIITAKEFLEE